MVKIAISSYILFVIVLSGCSGLAIISKIPPPSPGLVIFINQNEWAQGEILVFDSDIKRNDLFGVSSKGNLVLNARPLARIPFSAAIAISIPTINHVLLDSRQSYSLIFFYENKVGQFINVKYGFVRTTDNGYNESFKDFYGRQFWADRVVYLPRVNYAEAKPYRLKIVSPE